MTVWLTREWKGPGGWVSGLALLMNCGCLGQVTLHLPLPPAPGLSLLIWKKEVLPRISDSQRIQRTQGWLRCRPVPS